MFLLIFCLGDLCIIESGVLQFPTIITLLSLSPSVFLSTVYSTLIKVFHILGNKKFSSICNKTALVEIILSDHISIIYFHSDAALTIKHNILAPCKNKHLFSSCVSVWLGAACSRMGSLMVLLISAGWLLCLQVGRQVIDMGGSSWGHSAASALFISHSFSSWV